jgi:hypothetical protein
MDVLIAVNRTADRPLRDQLYLDPAHPCSSTPPPFPGGLLGYAPLVKPRIRESIRRLATILRPLAGPTGRSCRDRS